MAEYLYVRNFVDGEYDIYGKYVITHIESELSLSSTVVQCDLTECKVITTRDLTVEEKILLDSIVDASRVQLDVLKADRVAAIQQKTIEEEGKGVPYNNYRFSITASAKTNWLAIVVASASLTYPFQAPTGFDAIYSFSDVNDVLAFFNTSMMFLKYWEQSSEELCIAINACTTRAEIDAIIDDRTFPPQ